MLSSGPLAKKKIKYTKYIRKYLLLRSLSSDSDPPIPYHSKIFNSESP